ncbi:hypothetical protein WJX73_000708 [Symbiochloris irregularis]|uniref:Uncharacterized protein n=1 Tax=Symbiochloris irregularis TaxID=706552 RepID=A0AAW1NTY3_9CHLO
MAPLQQFAETAALGRPSFLQGLSAEPQAADLAMFVQQQVQAAPLSHMTSPDTASAFSLPSKFSKERDWDQFHSPRNLVLALVGEVGELAEVFQWKGDAAAGKGLPGFSSRERHAVNEELADVLLYLIRLSDICGCDLASAALAKLDQNARKYPASQVRGSSAKYDTYTQGQAQPQHAGLSSPTPAPSLAQPVPEALLSGLLAQHLSTPSTSTPSFLPNGGAQVQSAGTAAAASEGTHARSPTTSTGQEGDATTRKSDKRKHFSEVQVQALQDLAEAAAWRLRNVSKAKRDQFCAEWDISHERLINFINNRKPQDLKARKKARVQRPGANPDAAGAHG